MAEKESNKVLNKLCKLHQGSSRSSIDPAINACMGVFFLCMYSIVYTTHTTSSIVYSLLDRNWLCTCWCSMHHSIFWSL